tara:strand:- start:4560 stop:6470 length:1911 start_codon:yes stop_codon:yes gene_type:complete
MCGIIFILSKKNNNVIDYIFKSLELLQNRGYDSMGICYSNINSYKYEIVKEISFKENDCLNLLKKKFINKDIFSKFGIGHTRWATHGSKDIINAHPHISEKGNIILVHNGIINNYDILKNKLKKNGINFYGDTDSEVICNLIEYYIIYMNNDVETAIKNTINELDGTWALIILYTKELDTYYVSRKGSPLLLGNNDNYIVCSSQINGFAGLIYNYISLNDNSIIKIQNNNYEFISSCKYEYQIKKVASSDIIDISNQYNHWFIKEIMEQPETIQKAYNYGGRIINNFVKLGGLEQIKYIINYIEHVIFIGCGTSYNASLIGEYYFNSSKNFITVKAINACEFNKNQLPNINNKSKILCIFLSQSGETIDLYNCLNICKEEKVITLGIINSVDSLISSSVLCGVYLNAGPEISVASTKSFTSMIIILSLIEIWFTQNLKTNFINNVYYPFIDNKLDNLRNLSSTIKTMLYSFSFLNSIKLLKDFIIESKINNIFILSKNILFPIACEACLKIKETCYIHAESFSAGSLKHGPFALLDKDNLTILLIDCTDVNSFEKIKSTYHEILSRETNIFVFTNSKIVLETLNLKENKYILLEKLDYYNEIIFIIALQYLCYEISIAKGINPDKPKNLAKTVTVE